MNDQDGAPPVRVTPSRRNERRKLFRSLYPDGPPLPQDYDSADAHFAATVLPVLQDQPPPTRLGYVHLKGRR